jgi:phosphohistidine swiveling domain-containing protein/protein-tyrosine-phosphatase
VIRFFHSVEKIVFLDGDDVRRAPMAAALFRRYIACDPVLRVWRPEVTSAGSGKFTAVGAPPDKLAQKTMLSLGLDISFHKANALSFSDIEESSLVLGFEQKHVQYVLEHICPGYPSYASRVLALMSYYGVPDQKFDSLIGTNDPSLYASFCSWLEMEFSRLVYRFKEDTYLPLVAIGKGLGSGVVQGRVKIVKSLEQSQEIKKGDILVCDTNHIVCSYGRAADLASAIVTNSASEMSHLSQLSYELNIPCVGGTQYGTEVLHDGLRIVVDATTGNIYEINQLE